MSWGVLNAGLWLCLIAIWGVNGETWNVVVGSKSGIAETDDNFVCATLDWWPPEKCDYGTCSWGMAGLLNLDLSNPIFLNAVKAFSPLKVRLGGTLQDKVIYETDSFKYPDCHPFVRNTSEAFGFTEGCLPMNRWDELNGFFTNAGAIIIFGLNALNGRVRNSDGSLGGPWNYSNAEALIRYTVQKGYNIHGWELGNELSGSGVGFRVGADQYAADVIALKKLIDGIYGYKANPLVLAPGGFFEADWFSKILVQTKPNYLDVITHHIYNLGPGVDTHLVEKILDPSYLDGEAKTFSDLQAIIKNTGSSATAWVGEAGGAYNSGRHLVTDSFVFSFWYLDQLGMSSTYGTKSYCRQSLVGGNYGLLNTTTFHPNPDYYSALLWHRLMGKVVLATNFTGSKSIRAYSHCAKHSRGIVVLLINLSANETTQVQVTSDIPFVVGGADAETTREEYHLTAKNGDIQSQTMLLNGKELVVGSDGSIPSFVPTTVVSTEPIVVAPFSIVYAHLPSFVAPACAKGMF